tara:strand:- start:997 stop:2385 length:1389 start_codon:yes stop_codon:yes gene_type:complete
MGGGLLQLVAYGAQDVYLTGNPQITFFKVVYRRHTNFAMEAIEQSFNGNPSIGSRVSVLVTRNGDLINRIYFKATLKNKSTDKKLALVPYYGLRLLKNIELEIGGQRIDKHYSEWLYIWNELSMPVGKKTGYDVMVGGNKRNTSVLLAEEAEVEVYVPLEFWFCRNVGLALPLIALQYHEVKINIEYANANELVDQNDGNFSYGGAGENEKESNDNNNAANKGGTLSMETSQLWVDYIFLDTDERRRFAQLSHEYLIEQLQFTGADKITESLGDALKSVRMNFNHPVKELIWTIKPDSKTGTSSSPSGIGEVDTKESKPYWNNFSSDAFNNYNHVLADGVSDEQATAGTADVSVLPSNPVRRAKLQLNGNDRFAERDGAYFSIVQPYQHHENTPNHHRLGINVYSFALKPEEHQPSGTLNMSRIDSAHLQVASKVTGLISVYAVNYNVLRILSGMGGLAYSN